MGHRREAGGHGWDIARGRASRDRRDAVPPEGERLAARDPASRTADRHGADGGANKQDGTTCDHADGDDRPADRWDGNGVSASEAARGFRLATD